MITIDDLNQERKQLLDERDDLYRQIDDLEQEISGIDREIDALDRQIKLTGARSVWADQLTEPEIVVEMTPELEAIAAEARGKSWEEMRLINARYEARALATAIVIEPLPVEA